MADSKTYRLATNTHDFSFARDAMAQLIDAACAFARTGQLAAPDIYVGSSLPLSKPIATALIKMAVRSAATDQKHYEADGRNFKANVQYQALVDMIAGNVKTVMEQGNIPFHPDAVSEKELGAGR